MQSVVARVPIMRNSALKSSVRTFASSSARSQAVPTEKPVLSKQFKIYRWVSPCARSRSNMLNLFVTLRAYTEPRRASEETNAADVQRRP